MPPKRRKQVEPVDAPESKKRATRSSTKTKVNTETTLTSIVSNREPKLSKSSDPTNSKSRSKGAKLLKQSKTSDPSTNPPKTSKVKTNIDEDVDSKPTPSAPHNDTTSRSLTITHTTVKSPIICQAYDHPSSSTPTLIFTHGAGGTLSAPAVVNFCTGYSSLGAVLAFQGSMNLGARVKGFAACLEHIHEKEDKKARMGGTKVESAQLVLGGRSIGARAAVIAATEILSSTNSKTPIPVKLLLASYPLVGPKDVRDQILLDLPAHVNLLFVIGDRDSMCPLEMLNDLRKKIKAKSWLIVVEGADHGMHGGGKEKEKRMGEMAGRMAGEWLDGRREWEEERVCWDADEEKVQSG